MSINYMDISKYPFWLRMFDHQTLAKTLLTKSVKLYFFNV